MFIDKPGIVTERILLLGRRESCVYLLKGKDEYALIGGGMAYIVPEILDQLRTYDIDEEKISRIIILHSHFDHCGIVEFFKKRWPWAGVTASARARELLEMPKVIETIARLNRSMTLHYGREKQAESLGLDINRITVEQTVGDGDILRCGDLDMRILEVPGHSSCSIAVYVPSEKALFASDAGGIPFGDRIFTAANSNFDLYQQSLEKMMQYPVDVHLAEHYGAVTGEDARIFLKKAVAAAGETRHLIETSYARTGDVHKSTNEVTDLLLAEAPGDFLPREVVVMVAGQMVRFIARSKGRVEELGMQGQALVPTK